MTRPKKQSTEALVRKIRRRDVKRYRAQFGRVSKAAKADHTPKDLRDSYREPMEVRSGAVPADLLARLDSSRHNHATGTPQSKS